MESQDFFKDLEVQKCNAEKINQRKGLKSKNVFPEFAPAIRNHPDIFLHFIR